MRTRAVWLLALGAALGPRADAAAGAPRAPTVTCAPGAPQPGPGVLEPFRPPSPKATELNAAAKVPYRQGKWEEARAQYRAALAADPEFLAPKLNVACSFVRQERFADATAEVLSLLERAYVPWAREILEAADLGALKVRPEMERVRAAMAASAARWGQGLDDGVLFVARQRPPLRLPDGPGVFLLNPQQEVWAFSPRTQRYRPLTAEDGHVVALAVSADRRRALYVTAEKLVRGARPEDVALRGVVIHALTLATMAAARPVSIEGDVRRLEIHLANGLANGDFLLELETDRTRGFNVLGPSGGLQPIPPPPKKGRTALTVLTGRGVTAPVTLQASTCKTGQGAALGGLPIP